ncbi:hypothetical protein KC361_g266 [Hortaea werneckii]|nr:hypothetical protein KC361_g266 [Hortaea werneckii]
MLAILGADMRREEAIATTIDLRQDVRPRVTDLPLALASQAFPSKHAAGSKAFPIRCWDIIASIDHLPFAPVSSRFGPPTLSALDTSQAPFTLPHWQAAASTFEAFLTGDHQHNSPGPQWASRLPSTT